MGRINYRSDIILTYVYLYDKPPQGAVDEKNKMPYYAEPCPCMLAVTYSNGHSKGDRNIVTTDASTHGGCTNSFSGTSAAAPIAAGMVALMLQVR